MLRKKIATAIRKFKKEFIGWQQPLRDFLLILTRTISFLVCVRAGMLLAGRFLKVSISVISCIVVEGFN